MGGEKRREESKIKTTIYFSPSKSNKIYFRGKKNAKIQNENISQVMAINKQERVAGCCRVSPRFSRLIGRGKSGLPRTSVRRVKGAEEEERSVIEAATRSRPLRGRGQWHTFFSFVPLLSSTLPSTTPLFSSQHFHLFPLWYPAFVDETPSEKSFQTKSPSPRINKFDSSRFFLDEKGNISF